MLQLMLLPCKSAINSAGLTGIQALLGKNNNIYLESTSGMDIEITGDPLQNSVPLVLLLHVKYAQSVTTEGFFTNWNDLLSNYITGDKYFQTF